MTKYLRAALIPVAFILLAFAYLYPGSRLMLEGSQTSALSDDGDVSTLTWTYDQFWQTFVRHPSRFFYGAVYLDGINAERGVTSWVPWNERWLALAFHPLVPLEQIPTAFVLTLLVLDGLAMFALGRAMTFGAPVSFALGAGWAFSSYSLARAQTHFALVGTYHLPLIFLGLIQAARGRSMRAAGLLLLAATVTHYYLVTAAVLTPFYYWFFAGHVRDRLGRATGRLMLAALPAMVFLAWNVARPVPAEVRDRAGESLPDTGRLEPGQTMHPYLKIFGARPIDFFSADLWPGSSDWNPLRARVNRAVIDDMARGGRGNSHERTNGVQWVILVLALIALLGAARRGSPLPRWMVLLFATLGLAGLSLALAPFAAAPSLSLAAWLARVVPQIRVPSRAGIIVEFAALMLAGLAVARTRRARWLRAPGVLAALVIADHPPLWNQPRVSEIRPAVDALARERGACGLGLFVPFVSKFENESQYYWQFQRLRGTDCLLLNATDDPARAELVSREISPTLADYAASGTRDRAARALARYAGCLPLTWILFHPDVPASWRARTCAELGWTLNSDGGCVAPDHTLAPTRTPEHCSR